MFDANYKKLQIKQYRYDVQLAANNMELMKKQIQENYANAILQLNHNMEVLKYTIRKSSSGRRSI